MKHIHFIGIGGIGMSSLARYFHAQGYVVTGSDNSRNETIRELESEGISIAHTHLPEHLSRQITRVIYSEAIPPENPERIEAERLGIPQFSYFAALGDISQKKYTVSICGTHGKSTTTAMAGLALEHAEIDPFVILGTKVFEWGKKNIRLPQHLSSSDTIFLVESCEYHHSFLHLSPRIIAVTNMEPDHLDFFGTPEKYYNAFRHFAEKLGREDVLIANFQKKHIASIFSRCLAQKRDYSQYIHRVPPMSIPGQHNIENAACVLAIADSLSADEKKVRSAISRFHGTWRRFEKKGESNGILVFDDYAHHPTEIRATLSAFRKQFPTQKIWAVFQPHQYSRTRVFLREFSNSFFDADEVLIPNIYRVRDSKADVASVSADILVEQIRKTGTSAHYTHNFPETVTFLQENVKPSDVIVTIGAGPVHEVGELFLQS